MQLISTHRFISGAWLFEKKFRWHDRSELVRMGFMLFLTLPQYQQGISNERFSETQKTFERILETVRGWQTAGVTSHQMEMITNCDVDTVGDRSLEIMSIILLIR